MRYDGNLAYDYDFEAVRAKREEKLNEEKKNRQAKNKVVRAKLYRSAICSLVIISLCAGFMISRDVAAYESKRNVDKLQDQLNVLKEYSSEKEFELDQCVDLDEVEKIATTKLNMIRPEKYQMVYVNIKQDDVTEVTAKDSEGIKKIVGIFGDEEQ